MSNLDEIIIESGGSVIQTSCPAVIPQALLSMVNVWIPTIQEFFNKIQIDDEVVIALVNSPGFCCRVRCLKQNKYVILVPLGMIARIRVLSRLLMRYWKKESRTQIINSPLDNISWHKEGIPKLLKPIFLDDTDFDSYWDEIYELDKTIDIDQQFDGRVNELVFLSLVYLTSHEFTHILHGHFDLLDRLQRENFEISKEEIQRGLELDADDGATAVSMEFLLSMEELVLIWRQEEPNYLNIFWLSYAVTMLLGVFDAHNKYLGSYDKGSYNHPLIRRELFSISMLKCIDASESIKEHIKFLEFDGWQKCFFAFNDLTLDAMNGMFGKVSEDYQAPLHTLLYGTPWGAAHRVEFDLIREALKLQEQVRTLLPIFRKKNKGLLSRFKSFFCGV
jgi:hypothetical protein